MPDRHAHEERADEERAGIDVHRFDDSTVLLDDGEALVIPVDDEAESYDTHRWLMRRRRGDHRYERGNG